MTRFSSMHAERVSQVAREQAEEEKKAAPPGGRVLSRTTLSHLGLAAPAWYMRREKIQGLTSAPTSVDLSGPSSLEADPSSSSSSSFSSSDCTKHLPDPVEACKNNNNGYWLNNCESTCKQNGCVWKPGTKSHWAVCHLAGASSPASLPIKLPDLPIKLPDKLCDAIKSDEACTAANCVWAEGTQTCLWKGPPTTCEIKCQVCFLNLHSSATIIFAQLIFLSTNNGRTTSCQE